MEGVCSASTTKSGAEALIVIGGIAPTVKAMTAAEKALDRELEQNLIEFGAMAMANLASHLETKVTDSIIAADGHLALISLVSDGRVSEAAALASTRALHNLAAGNIKGQVLSLIHI